MCIRDRDYPHAMALMAATLPRKLSLSHLREVVVSEEIARTEDFYPLLLQIQSSYEAEENAFLVVSPVSYTHLDVYKRQISPWCGRTLFTTT